MENRPRKKGLSNARHEPVSPEVSGPFEDLCSPKIRPNHSLASQKSLVHFLGLFSGFTLFCFIGPLSEN